MSKKHTDTKKILRLMDANLNRLKEGLRVLEDILRFIIDDAELMRKIKKVRHTIVAVINKNKNIKISSLILERQIEKDVGRHTISAELTRKNTLDLFLANAQRAKESIRVLEEFTKLYDSKVATRFKQTRYKIYEIEKQAIEKISNL